MAPSINAAALRVYELFHIADNTTFLVCSMDEEVEVSFPCTCHLYRGKEYLRDIILESVVMGGYKTDEDGRRFITFTTPGHIDKSLFDFKKGMLLKMSRE